MPVDPATKGVKECPKLLKLGKPETEKNNQIIQCAMFCIKLWDWKIYCVSKIPESKLWSNQ